jgi:hypothetical protein
VIFAAGSCCRGEGETEPKEDDMHSPNGKRVRRVIPMVAALAAVAILALSGLAAARDHHGERHRHGQDSGTIASFNGASGMLSIALTGGETVSGLVTPGTRIRCEDQSSPDSAVRGRESEPGDDHGGQGEEPGDDNGGQGNEPGDDNGGGNSGPGSSQPGPSGHDDNGDGANCTASDLTVGATVHQAELDLRNGMAVFGEVELAG